MIKYPIAKINLGLLITEKRTDGFHNLETIFYPVPVQDALEVVQADDFEINISGIELDVEPEENIVVNAFRLLKKDFELPPVHIHLHKNIPVGAGLGGGSSDASTMLLLLNELFELGISEEQLLKYALELGSDCPFFINPRPVLARGRGELIQDVPLNLSGFYLIIVKPPVSVSTAWAYQQVIPAESRMSLRALVNFPVERWKGNLQNHFEKPVFAARPEVGEIRKTLYAQGAAFAMMSGSGSAVYGLFRSEKRNIESQFPADYQVFRQKL